MTQPMLVGKGTEPVFILPRMANRHGLVAGATGTGKTVTLQRLAEGFSRIGVPVFLADVKGDLSGLALRGGGNPRVAERAKAMRLPQEEGFVFDGNPVMFWDILGEQGHPVRATVSDMGPMLLARLLNLNETQEGVLDIVFQVADDNGWLLLDLKDLRALLNHVVEISDSLRGRYGSVSGASVGAIQRRLLGLERQGAERLFGEPALELQDLLRTDDTGRGYISILAADQLIHTPALYSSFLLWLLSELFEELPEIGDPDKPRLVLFFDEAHLLFKDAPPVLLDKIEQVTRLIRSKGVGLYFVTQTPLDIPDRVLGQLGNRVQHALRAYTPRDQKAVRVAAQTFRANPALDTEAVIGALGVGEALVSTLDEQGVPGMVQRIAIAPPASRVGPATPEERQAILDASPVKGVYDVVLDRISAYEILERQAAERAAGGGRGAGAERDAGGRAAGRGGRGSGADSDLEAGGGSEGRGGHGLGSGYERPRPPPGSGGERPPPPPGRGGRQTPTEAFAASALRSIGSQVGRQLARGLLGSLTGGRTRR